MERGPERSFGEMFESLRRNPDFWLWGAAAQLEDTGNPYYAWVAVRVCIEHNKEFPAWVLAYLSECADRILSDEAKVNHDLRKVLPWALGFPNALDPSQRKRGPGNLLDPAGDPDRMDFALKFFVRLLEGQTVPAAMREACNAAFDEKNDNIDEKTLRRWLLKELKIKEGEEPSDANGWKAAASEYYRSLGETFRYWDEVSRDSDVTGI